MSRIGEPTHRRFPAAFTLGNATPQWLPTFGCNLPASPLLLPLLGAVVLLTLAPPTAAQDPSTPRRTASRDAPSVSLESLIAAAEKKTDVLAGKLRACKAAGQDIALADADLAVAELFIVFSRHDSRVAGLRKPALASMQYIRAMLDRALAEADDALEGKVEYPQIPDWNVMGLQVRDGSARSVWRTLPT